MGPQGETKTLQPSSSVMAHHVLLSDSTTMPGDPISLPSIRAWKFAPSLANKSGVKRRRTADISLGKPSVRTVTSPAPLSSTSSSSSSSSLSSLSSSPPRLLPAMMVPTSARAGTNNNNNNSNNTKFQAQWLFFSNFRWVPLDRESHHKLERTLELGGVFADIQDSHFPDVQRIRVFPGADYLSYLGIRYRISRVLLPSV